MSEQPNETSDVKHIYCNSCKDFTNHIRKATHVKNDIQDPEDKPPEIWRIESILWACAGCETAVLESRLIVEHSEEKSPPIVNALLEFAPERHRDDLPTKSFRKLPKKLGAIYQEVIQAFNKKLYILTAAGLRALIEGICADKNIGGHNLVEKIDNLISILPQNIVANLHGFRFIGNVAMHELNPPSRDDLRLAIEVSEDLLNFIYELDYKSSRLPKPVEQMP